MENQKNQNKKQQQVNTQNKQLKQEKQDPTNQTQELKKDPETLSEGERMGLSKQQLRKLQKRLNAKKKKQNKEKQEEVKKQKQIEPEKQQKKPKGNKKQLPQQYIKEFQSQKIPVLPNKKLPSPQQDNILITSALPYVNNVPHLGNIIGCVLSADVYARFKRLQGSNVLYICGTDQYGTATQVKALQEKKTPKEVCDFYHKIHNQVYQWFDIAFDHFGRTSTVWHQKICQQIFMEIRKNGKIKQEQMTQCFCEHCDLFLADRFICGICPHCQYEDARGDQCDKCQKLFNNPTQMKDYKCSICKNTPIIKQTIHFFIDLPQIQKGLQEWVQQSSIQGKWTENSIATTKAWLNMGLKPKCITRDLKWGVSVPLEQFNKKVFYVWFDAPIGYISITANLLEEQYKSWWHSKQVKLYQFMGKDNVPFHTVMFPASLIASQLPWTLLHHVSTTEYLNYENGKFSKRNGTGVFGDTASTTGIPSQVWRYYLLINRPQIKDSQFSWKQFIDRNNNQLLANLGNLVQRALKYCFSTYKGKIPVVQAQKLSEVDHQFLNHVKTKYNQYVEALNKVEIKDGLKISMELSSLGNKYLQDSKFWEKPTVESGRTQIVISVICNFIRLLSLVFEPYMPSTSAKINFLLGCQSDPRNPTFGTIFKQGDFTANLLRATQNSKDLRQPVPLFTEYSQEQMNTWRVKFAGKQGQQQKIV